MFSAYIRCSYGLMFDYWYRKKKNGGNFYETSNSEHRNFFWYWDTIGGLRSCVQNFHFWSLSFGIGLWSVPQNLVNRSIHINVTKSHMLRNTFEQYLPVIDFWQFLLSLSVVVKTRQNGKLRFQPPPPPNCYNLGGGCFFGSKIFVFNFKQFFFRTSERTSERMFWAV